MSGKLRIVLGVLVLAAAGSVSYLLPSVSPAHQKANVGDALTLKNDLSDTDGDGLIDRDEVYWRTDINNRDTDGDGFLDGEEILTGHNPLVKGPNDFLSSEQNATTRITGLVVGGLIAGDLDPENPNYEASVKMLADAMATEYGKVFTIPLDTLTVVEDSDESKIAYVKAMSIALLKTVLPATTDTNTFFSTYKDVPIASRSWATDNPQRYVAFVKDAKRYSAAMESGALKLIAIPVPKLFEQQHIGAVQFLRSQQRYYELIAQLKENPSLASVALGELMRIQYQGAQDLLYDFASALSIKLQ